MDGCQESFKKQHIETWKGSNSFEKQQQQQQQQQQ
jgi:hypothetical protein